MRNSRGAGLVEVMMATGILGIVASAGLSVSSMSTKMTSQERLRNSVNRLESDLFSVFENGNFCSMALSDSSVFFGIVNPSPVTLTADAMQGSAAGAQEITMYLIGSKTGPTESNDFLTSSTAGNANYIISRGIKVDSLRLQNVVATGSTNVPPGQTQYVGRIFLQASSLDGTQVIKPRHLATILFNVDATNKLKSCRSSNAVSQQQACADLGCTYNAVDTPPCSCPPPVVACGGPALYPVAVRRGGLVCLPLGGKNCPPGQVLVGVGIGEIKCKRVTPITLEFEVMSSTANEGTSHNINVILSEPYRWPVTVDVTPLYTVGAGYADSGDISPSGPQTLTIPANTTLQPFAVNITNLDGAEPTESVRFDLSNIVSPGGDVILGPRHPHTLNIQAITCPTPLHTWGSGSCSAPSVGPIAENTVYTPVNNTAFGYAGSFSWTCPMGGGAAVASAETCSALPCTTPSSGNYTWGAGCLAPNTGLSVPYGGPPVTVLNTNPVYIGDFTWSCPSPGVAAVATPGACNPIPPPPTCTTSPDPYIWGVDNCSHVAAVIPEGMITTVPNDNGPSPSGSVDWDCPLGGGTATVVPASEVCNP